MDLAHEYVLRFYSPFLYGLVSILVLMDLAHEFPMWSQNRLLLQNVSILVLMDLAHEYTAITALMLFMGGFNPCFNGSCSRMLQETESSQTQQVSILVLMDLAHE